MPSTDVLICGIFPSNLEIFLLSNPSALVEATKLATFQAYPAGNFAEAVSCIKTWKGIKFVLLTNMWRLRADTMIAEASVLAEAIEETNPDLPVLLDSTLAYLRKGPLEAYIEREITLVAA